MRILSVALIILNAFGFNFRKALDYFKNSMQGKDSLPGIMIFVALVVAIVGLLAFAQRSHAEDRGEWFKTITIDVAAIRPFSGSSIFCEPGGADDKTTAYGSLSLSIYERSNFQVYAKLEHHQSCVLNADAAQQDGWGAGFRYTFDIHSLFR